MFSIQRRAFLWRIGAGAAGVTVGAGPVSDNGFKSLFDGTTLTGWHKPPRKMRHGTGGTWVVEPGGVLAGEQDPPGSGNGGICLSDKQKVFGILGRKGSIGLQIHQGTKSWPKGVKCRWRNIRIKRL